MICQCFGMASGFKNLAEAGCHKWEVKKWDICGPTSTMHGWLSVSVEFWRWGQVIPPCPGSPGMLCRGNPLPIPRQSPWQPMGDLKAIPCQSRGHSLEHFWQSQGNPCTIPKHPIGKPYAIPWQSQGKAKGNPKVILCNPRQYKGNPTAIRQSLSIPRHLIDNSSATPS